jgi:hypothetical protein
MDAGRLPTPVLAGQALCETSPPYTAGDASRVMSLTADMRFAVEFDVTAICLLVDGQHVDGVRFDRMDAIHETTWQRSVPIAPGQHELKLFVALQGGHGIRHFEYLAGYSFDVQSHHTINVGDANPRVRACAFELGTVRTPLERRPDIEWNVDGEPNQERPGSKTRLTSCAL